MIGETANERDVTTLLFAGALAERRANIYTGALDQVRSGQTRLPCLDRGPTAAV